MNTTNLPVAVIGELDRASGVSVVWTRLQEVCLEG